MNVNVRMTGVTSRIHVMGWGSDCDCDLAMFMGNFSEFDIGDP